MGCASANQSHETPRSPQLTPSDMERNPGESIERILQAKEPSLQISSSPGGLTVTIRGPSSFVSGSTPLYVLDGSPVPVGANGLLTGLNPYDIESIRLLKNPADVGIYGMQGANGVIVITTKRPSKRD